MGRKSFTLEDCQKHAEGKGGKCLSDSYKNSKTFLEWECKDGYKWAAAFVSIKYGHWCPHCAGTNKVTAQKYHKLAKSKNGEFLSKTTEGNKQKSQWKCKNNHIFLMRYNDIEQQNQWCPECSKNKKHDLKWCQDLASKKDGFCLATEYSSNKMKCPWKCKKGHTWETTPHNIANDQWCPVCQRSYSKAQLEIFEFIKKIYPESTSRQRNLLKKPRRELDIWIPNLRIGIEYDGDLYWHSTRFKHYRSSDDTDKDQMCNEADIRLIRVKESTYTKNKNRRLLELLIQIQLYVK